MTMTDTQFPHTHPSEDELVLHFYGEAGTDEERRIDGHLATCAACQAQWIELSQTLKLVDTVTVPEPAEGFEQRMWARVQQALPQAETAGQVVAFTPKASFIVRYRVAFSAIGIAAALLLAFVAGRGGWWLKPAPAAAVAKSASTTRPERVLLTALGDHFDQAQTLLVELMNAPEGRAVDINFERETASDLLSSSRLFRQTAQRNGNVRLASMLEDLESVLVEVANSPDKVDKNDFEALRKRIDGDNLLFKVRAITTEIQERQKQLSTLSEGEL